MTRTPKKTPKHLIAVLGVTGAGKTTFISRATGRDDLAIGHSLESCTEDVASYETYLDGELVQLIDTPGFDDTYRSDTEILELLATWLHKNSDEGVVLTGVILLQPINANRIQGSERRRLRLFEKICGPNSFSKIVIATTMWDEISCDAVSSRRMQDRVVSADCWGTMAAGGARVERHDNNADSARRIVSLLCGQSRPMQLLMQQELANNGGALAHTSAGNQLYSELDDRCKSLLASLEELRQEQKIKDGLILELADEKEALDSELKRIQHEKERLENPRVSATMRPYPSIQLFTMILLLAKLHIFRIAVGTNLHFLVWIFFNCGFANHHKAVEMYNIVKNLGRLCERKDSPFDQFRVALLLAAICSSTVIPILAIIAAYISPKPLVPTHNLGSAISP